MPYEIEVKAPMVTVTFCQGATFTDIGDAGQEIRSLPEFPNLKHVILDGRKVSFTRDTEVLKIIRQASIDKPVAMKFQNRKLAFVATDPVIVEWSAIYRWEMEKYNWQVESFATLNEAHQWIFNEE